ncbi:F0F1 ATP synthase subunit A [Actinotalea sp. K2]|uniref:F0F1 ATP synthase subunit A n=1 Tax=Actinotalea sp. K2 TaxID=2939438 RepID=UPI0020177870|nr:F0F1 ATP synthase subunit A [Actinotalea sp. K2]MCL3860448.1 F0F1 ATP synthase subunit A [Actinotalea sp. K2]
MRARAAVPLDLGECALITAATNLLLAAPGEDGGFHVPNIGEFFPPAIAFEGTIFEFNRITLVRFVAALVLCTLFWLVARRASLIPGRAQNIAEMGLDFVRVNIAEEVLGKAHARPFVPLLTTLFFAILAMNITGVVPLLNIASTSVVAVPLILAVVAWIAFVYAGIKAHGPIGYLRTSLFPSGVPWPIYIILAPIELISTFILRPATLTIRLMANMLAGHLLLVIFFALTNYLFVEASGAVKAVGVVTFGAAFAFTIFEIFIAALQAYIFTLLTAVYINLSQEAH